MISHDPETSRPAAVEVPLAVIGLGCLFPKADGRRAYWANIKRKLDCITEVPPSHWRPEDYYDPDPRARDKVYAKRGGFLDPVDFNPLEFGISPRDIEAIDTTQLLGLLAAKQALEDAGYGPDRTFDREKTSVILGITGALEMTVHLGARLGHPQWKRALAEAGVDDETARDVLGRISGSYVEWQENSFPGLLGNVAAGRIANRLDLGGTNCVVDAACASSLSAVHLAALELASGRSNMVITGGMDTFNDVFMYACFSKTPALSPSGNARPFDADGDGTTLGEGLGVVVLKRLDDAERDGDRIYAVLLSVGSSSDGKGTAVYAPNPEGQVKALRRAYELAGVTPDTIELIEAHGTGTKVGDEIELRALTKVFGESDRPGPWCALGAVKSQIGHTKAAAGAAGLIKAVLALYYKVLPPTIKVNRPLELAAGEKTPLYVNTETTPWLPSPDHPRRAGVSAFGFGGSNFHCLLEEHRKSKEAADWDGRVQILAWSASDREALLREIGDWPVNMPWAEVRRRAARSRAGFDRVALCRLVLVVEEGGQIVQVVERTIKRLQDTGEETSWQTPDGAFFGKGGVPGGLAFLFSGQGSQYPGMLRDLTCQFPVMLEALEEADEVFEGQSGGPAGVRLSRYIYPLPAFTEEAVKAREKALRDTRVAQPALGALGLGLFRLLESFGLSANVLAGHSYGELLALCASGRFQPGDLHRLSNLRGALMARNNGHSGSMLAVRASAEKTQAVLTEAGLNLVVANKNAPEQTVLSGSSEDVDRAAGVLDARGMRCTKLNVSAAFHSPWMAHASEPFHEALREVAFDPARIPVYANTTAEPYPTDPEESRKLLAGQLVTPVEFVREIENLYNAGVRTFLEVGPGRTLTGLTGAILDGRDHAAMAVDSSRGQRSGLLDLARVLAQLAALGYPVELACWEEGQENHAAGNAKPGFTVAILGANQFAPKSQPPPREKQAFPASQPRQETKTGTSLRVDNISPTPLPAKSAASCNRQSVSGPSSNALAEALNLTQANMAVLQDFQAKTADLHRQFLAGQEESHRTMQALIRQQQRLMEAALGMPGEALPAFIDAPTAGVRFDTALAAPVFPAQTAPAPLFEQTERAEGIKSAGLDRAEIERALLRVVSENTGYPAEMLNLEMSLDNDLGIDSIKRVEIFSALAATLPEARTVGPDQLGVLQTLAQVVDFLAAGAGAETAALAGAACIDAARAAEVLLRVVAENTGYPVEMLNLEMSLDNDLGIDSIKRVEIFSVLTERLPDAPAMGPEQLGVLRTLGDVVAFLTGGPATTGPTPVCGKTEESPLYRTLLEVVAEQTGYPAETMQPELDLQADLGLDPVKLVEIAALVESRSPGLKPIETGHLSGVGTLGQLASLFVEKDCPELPAVSCNSVKSGQGLHRLVIAPVELNGSPRGERIVLPPGSRILVTDDGAGLADRVVGELTGRGFAAEILDSEALPDTFEELAGLVVLAPATGADGEWLGSVFELLKKAGPGLRRAGKKGGAVLMTVSRVDGAFGFEGLLEIGDPVSGGLAGLLKTAAREWPEVKPKAVDLSPVFNDPASIARVLVDELFLDGPIEVGLMAERRLKLDLREHPHNGAETVPPIQPGDLVLVTGGARGVTAEAALAMARAWRPRLVLAGRSPTPAPEPEWLSGLTDPAEIKKAILVHAVSPMTPKELESRYRELAAGREIVRNIERLRAAGSEADYLSLDVRDKRATASAVRELETTHGPIRGIVHGAGVLADQFIADKSSEQFRTVFSTKVDGLFALLEAVDQSQLKFLALFSSSTGRFGRTGQVDYAAANEVLNKVARQLAGRYPDCRVASFNWGPWEGGMVTPGLKKLFRQEGLNLIGKADGGNFLVRELESRSGGVEVVVLGGGSDLGRLGLPTARDDSDGLVSREILISLGQHPFLQSHVLDGQAVLPMAVMIEWMGRTALKAAPDLKFVGLEGLKVEKRLAFGGGEAVNIRIDAGPVHRNGGNVAVPVELFRTEGDTEIRIARARVILAADFEAPPEPIKLDGLEPYPAPETIYRDGRLFHGPDLQAIGEIEGLSDEGMAAEVRCAPAPVRWMKNPIWRTWLTDPLALDAAFQLISLWSREKTGLPNLPVKTARLRVFRERFPEDGIRVVFHIIRRLGPSVMADVDFMDNQGRLVARIEGQSAMESETLIEAYRNNRLHGLPFPSIEDKAVSAV